MKAAIKTVFTELSKKSVFLRKILRSLLYCYRYTLYYIIKVTNKTQDKTISFKSFNGKSYACSPKAIYEYMLSCEKYKDYKFIWAFKEPEKYRFLENNPNTSVVQDSCIDYLKTLARSKYWIHNYRVFDHIYPKADQIYVQCWHGTPLKKLGYDIEKGDNALNSLEEVRFKYKVDAAKFKYILSPSAFATDKFISAWNLKAIGKENAVIEKGYPRNDKLFNFNDDDVAEIKKSLGIDGIDKKVIFYAPTWRDNQHDSKIGYVYKTEVDFDKLRLALGDEYIILFRAHYLVANSFDFEKYSGFIYDVSSYDDINDLYIISNILITDYSSVFFDYANLRRPMLFYMYDFDAYKNEMRDFYFDIEELPGPIVKNEDDLIDAINRLDSYQKDYGEKYIAFHNKFNYLDDGNASRRVTDEIIEK